MTVNPATFPSTQRITIVLVHGAWTNGSAWRPVYDRLIQRGHSVVIAQQPLTSFEADVAAVARVLAMQSDPVILVGHCYGGAVITRVGNDPKVRALVYIAAHALEENETPLGNDRKFVDPASHAGADVRTTTDGFLYFEPSAYIEDYAADIDPSTAHFQAHAQVPTALDAFNVPAAHPAWKDKPSWYMVAGADRILSPDLERMYGRRAGSTVVEVPGASHAVHQSHPQEVVALIEQAAASCRLPPIQ